MNSNFGILVVEDRDGKTLVTEQWAGAEERRRLWSTWADIIRKQDAATRGEVTVKDYAFSVCPKTEGLSDKQIGYLMSMHEPARTMSSAEAAYAARNEADVTDYEAVKACVAADSARFMRFAESRQPLLALFNAANELQQGEQCHVQQVFRLKNNFSFMGSERIASNDDVAWLFRQLSNKAVENSFMVMSRGDESVILHMCVGNNVNTMVDFRSMFKAAERFNPDKIWFVHNHPSGNVMASKQDMAVWQTMYDIFGEKLQQGIIINTNTGQYGVFGKDTRLSCPFSKGLLGESGADEVEIPVLTFDRQVFNAPASTVGASLHCSSDIAEFLSTQRFGERCRYGFLCMNHAYKVTGNFFLSEDMLADKERLARRIVSGALDTNAVAVIVYDGHNGIMRQGSIPDNLGESIGRLSGMTVKLVDHISISTASNGLYSFRSAADEGLIHEPGQTYRTDAAQEAGVFDRVEVIPTSSGKGLLRCKVDGQWTPAVTVRAEDMRSYTGSGVTKEQLLDKYMQKVMATVRDTGQAERTAMRRF